jgi:hypothetical protein
MATACLRSFVRRKFCLKIDLHPVHQGSNALDKTRINGLQALWMGSNVTSEKLKIDQAPDYHRGVLDCSMPIRLAQVDL